MEDNRSSKNKKKRRNRKILYGVCALFLIVYTIFWKAYYDVNLTSLNIFNNLETNNKRESQIAIEATQPISFAFLGVDNGSLGREEDVGRS